MTLTRSEAVLVKSVDLRRLKKLLQKMLPEGSMLELVVRNEQDFISAEEYCAKLGTWLTILDEEISRL
ncbi:MAG: hypothetical protein JRN52_14855 [Nitrososphaerota archaeon]|nr:hypothetical protein [Nitrososphaerota archaeon]